MDTSSYWGLSVRPCGACRAGSSQLCCITCENLYLCPTCDTDGHSNHMRVPLCEVCERNPASITCRADAATLCVTCDADIHSANPLANHHVRVPVVPVIGILGKPILLVGFDAMLGEEDQRDEAEASTWLLAEPTGDTNHEKVENNEIANEFVWEVDGIDKGLYSPVYQEPSGTFSLTHSGSSSETGVVPEIELHGKDRTPSSGDREARLMRYREKRKIRRFEKTIRYASRKAYAETRPRMKGRFVKRAEGEAEISEIYSSAAAAVAALISNSSYGVVPSFYD